jgi:uncharacterized protein (DUF2267 family)
MAQNVDEAANFVFVQLTEQEPGIYDKCHADCATREKNRFGLGKNFSRDEVVWILVKVLRNNISTRV